MCFIKTKYFKDLKGSILKEHIKFFVFYGLYFFPIRGKYMYVFTALNIYNWMLDDSSTFYNLYALSIDEQFCELYK